MKKFHSVRRDFLRTGGLSVGATMIPALSLAASGQRNPGPSAESVSQAIFDVRKYGAAGDGKTLDTGAVNRAIEAAATAGGGVVVFPAGTYLCFSIRLR